MDDLKKIAFLGIGNMGYPMAINLHKKGYKVTVFDLSADAIARAKAEGLAAATDAISASTSADVVISMLPAAHHVESLYLASSGNTQGLLQQLKSLGQPKLPLMVDCSTISPESASW